MNTSLIQKSIFFLCIILSVVISGISGYLLGVKEPVGLSEIRLNDTKYTFINPLLDYQSNTPNLLRGERKALEQRLKTYIDESTKAGLVSNVSIYFRDLENGPWFAINDQLVFSPASLLKVPLMIAYFKLAEQNSDILNQTIQYATPYENVPEHSITGTDSNLTVGSTYTIQALIEAMIKDSDNVATLLLQENIDNDIAEKVFTDFGVPLPNFLSPTADYIQAREYAGFLRVLYNSTYLNRDYSERALELLSQSKFTAGLKAGLPENAKVSHKFGVQSHANGTKQLHDCGIIYSPDTKTYTLCIMTIGTDYNQMAEVIADLTTTIHTSLAKDN